MDITKMMRSLFAYSFCFGSMLMLASCGEHEEKKTEAVAAPFVINDSIARIIAIDTVQLHELEGNLELNGQVTFNQNTVIRVMPLVSGTVQNVDAQLGEYVKQGQVLATIRTGELSELQNNLISANANLSMARKNLDVAKELEKKGINSQKEVEDAQQEFNKSTSEVNSATQKLSIIGGTANGNEVIIKAPVSGYIVDRKVNPNQVIDENNSDPMFVVSDLKQVWVMANVYEADIEKVKVGETVKITTIAYPDKEFSGTINYISNVLDPDNKTLGVRVVLNNPDNDLKPEMFAKVILDFKEKRQVPSIPKNAVVFEDSKNYVVVYKSRDKLEVRQIDIYPTHKDLLYIKNGLNPGEFVIGKNQLLIYNALTSL